MDDGFTSRAIVNNEYDYSNVVPTEEAVSYLVQYCDQIYKQLTTLVNEEEEKNKQFKIEYQEFMYKKSYGQRFEIYIQEKTYNNITCNDYETFLTAVKNGDLKNVQMLNINLCLDFKRGKGETLDEHENSFSIIFKPYNIIFSRKSNHNDPTMNQVEQQIKEILNQFPVANSIFCSK